MCCVYFFFTACLDEQIEPEKTPTGEIALGMANETSSLETRSTKAQQTDPVKVMVTFKNSNDSTIYNKKLLDLYHFNGSYLTDNVKLPIGTYTIVEYFILDSSNQVIYAAPVEGSKLAQYVNNPLHLEFEVGPDKVTQVLPEVLAVYDFKPEDFGYTHFGFDLTELVAFEIAVFDKITKQFISSKIEITGDNLYSYTDSLEAKTNQVLVSDSSTEYTLTISQTGYESQTFTYTKDELISFVEGNGLLVHLMPKDISTREMKKIAAGYYSSFFIAPDGSVYAAGSNMYGQLGLSNTIGNQSSPIKMQLPAGTEAVGVAAGNNHTLVLDSDGNVYGVGKNNDGELGIGSTSELEETPVKMQLPTGSKIVRIAAGHYHSLLLDSEGNVYGVGQHYDGALGDGYTEWPPKLTPVKMKLPEGVVATYIAGGASFSLIVDSEGNAYGTGTNGRGELGLGHSNTATTPTKIPLPSGVKIVAASGGEYHSLLLDSDGNVYSFGLDEYGVLGIGSTGDYQLTPVKMHLPAGVKIVDIAASGYRHSLALDSEGNVYGTGNSGGGELGIGIIGNNDTSVLTPVKMHLPPGVFATGVAAGRDHSLVITSNGDVYSTGYNVAGELGLGNTGNSNQLTPAKVPLPW